MKKFDFKKILYNDRKLKLISILAAFLFWFIIVSYISPNYTRTVNNVSIVTDNSDLSLSYLKLSVIQLSQKKVSLEISGPRYLIGKLSASDFIVRPRFTQVTSAGSYDVGLTADFVTPDSRLQIKSINPSAINIYFDKIVSKSIPVEVVVQNTKIADGYIMQSAVVNPTKIIVTGPEQEMANISKAVATIKVKNNASEVLDTTSDIVVYNSDNKPTDIKHISLSVSKVNITVPILLTKTVPLTMSFKNLPAGFNSGNISYTVTPANVMIAGTTDAINGISQISLGDIDFSTLDINNTLKFNLQMPAGATDIENVGTASVGITLENIAEKTFSTKKINAVNVPSGLNVQVITKLINNIQLLGPSASITGITNVEAIVDMSKVQNGEGEYEVPVTITVPNKTGYWTKVQYKALIYVYK